MRWKLLRRRFSISAPRMIVRSHLPWPLRWAVAALALGFSAAIALWAFEFGKDLAGLDKDAKVELEQLRAEVRSLRDDKDKAQSIANTAESLLKTEKVAQERLALQLRQVEADNLQLKADLGFFERLLPAAGQSGDAPQVRAFQVDADGPGRLHYQVLVMSPSRVTTAGEGRYELTLSGTQDGKPWTQPMPGGPQAFQLRQYLRLEGHLDHPPAAVVKLVQLRVLDARGAVLASQSARL
ncbi:MAG: hypothetical protein J0M20_16525 [Burkholderiales bacterium]|nr:hypothetical protein [Burkholderiales bacterium]